MICEECGKRTRVCYRSNKKWYKFYICKECKSKEEIDASNVQIVNKGGENERKDIKKP